jgi:hypothetical protein
VRGIKAKLTNIDKTLQAISDDIGNKEKNIRANLKELQQHTDKNHIKKLTKQLCIESDPGIFSGISS